MPEPAAPPVPPEAPSGPSDPPRVLIVDKDTHVRARLAELLTLDGIVVTGGVGDAMAALRALADDPPTVVVTDVELADGSIDGLALAEAVRERAPGVRVIVHTVWHHFGMHEVARQRGAFGVAAKGATVLSGLLPMVRLAHAEGLGNGLDRMGWGSGCSR